MNALRLRTVVAAGLVSSLLAAPASAVFDFTLDFQSDFTPAQAEALEQGAQVWRDVILGYQPGISITGITLTVSIEDIDGASGILAQAGPRSFANQGGYELNTSGAMTFDSADINGLLASDRLTATAAHEFGHIIGIGTAWEDNGAYTSGTGQYTGEFGLNAYRIEFDPSADFIPVELDGGPGTANAHWDELDDVFDLEGRPMTEEMMTGYLGSENYLSVTTIESLRDLGFDVVQKFLTGVAGDINQDGVLDLLDVQAFSDGWLADTFDLNFLEKVKLGDLNRNGRTDQHDWFLLRSAFIDAGMASVLAGASPFGVAVPEPAAALLALAGVAMVSCRRRLRVR